MRKHRVNNESEKESETHDPTTKHGIVELLHARAANGCVAWRGRSCVCVCVGRPARQDDRLALAVVSLRASPTDAVIAKESR